jgi:hypothetical protein
VSAPGDVEGNPIRFTATGVAAPANATLTIQAGNDQTVGSGGTVPIAPAVLVTSGGVPQANVTVQFSGTGTITPQTVQTDANGIARLTSWQLPTGVGTYTLFATIPGTGASVQFTARVQ